MTRCVLTYSLYTMYMYICCKYLTLRLVSMYIRYTNTLPLLYLETGELRENVPIECSLLETS